MALTHKTNETIAIPGEPGESMTFRRLSHYQLSMAEDRAEKANITKFNAFADPSKLPQQSAEDRETAKAEAALPENKYDRMTVLQGGIVAWSYTDALSEDTLRELDEATAAWAFGEIIGMSVRTAEERKNSDGVSQPTSEALAAGQPS